MSSVRFVVITLAVVLQHPIGASLMNGNTPTRINLQSEATLQPDFIYKPLAPKSGVFLELLGTSLSALPSLPDITAVMFAQTIRFPAIGSPNFP